MNKNRITVDSLRAACLAHGFAFFEKGNLNLNIIGIRTLDDESNKFNDWLALAYCDRGEWKLHVNPITTDPGLYWRLHPMNDLGTAILAPGQYRGAYQLGKHRGRYEALVQAKELPVYRDNDGNRSLNAVGELDWGFHGINHHRASDKHQSIQVDKWSAGCQVHANPNHYDFFIERCKDSAAKYGNSFTYTLLEESDFDD